MSPPDHVGYYMEGLVLQVALTTYPRQPCPLMAPAVGRIFGKKGNKLDKYNANLVAVPLPSQGHQALHNKLQSIFRS